MKNKVSAFIGPLPPPLGGVAIINQSFQNIDYNDYKVISFDTSKKTERDDVYANFKLGSIKRNLQLNKRIIIFLAKNQPDVINIFITSGMSILRDILFLKRISKFNIPIIIHFHSKTKGEFALTPLRLKWIGKYFNKYANRIILLSKFHHDFFVKFFGEKKCIVVENFVKYSDFENEIENKNKDFLFVGRLSKEKGFFDLIEAVKFLKKKEIFCQIQIIGVAPNEDVDKEIIEIISKYNLKDYFIFNGATFGEAKNNLFKQTRCLIFPSHFENSPVVLKEAIAAKMSILSSDIHANENILQRRNNYLSFQVSNNNDLALKMSYLISNPEKVLKMCQDSASINDYDSIVAKNSMLDLFNTLTNREK